MIGGFIYSWSAIAQHLSAQPNGTVMRVEKNWVEHPSAAGMVVSLGLPVEQICDWRFPHPNCGGLHVREFATYYSAHMDQVNPACDPVGHIVSDAPTIAGGVALGATVGLALGRSAPAALAGAVFGGLLGVATAAALAKAPRQGNQED